MAVLPAKRSLEVDQAQRLVVLATFSDGDVRDVTDDAKFDTLNEGVATVERRTGWPTSPARARRTSWSATRGTRRWPA